MTTETRMTTAVYDVCVTNMDGTAEATVGLFRAGDTLTFTKEEWEVFKSTVDELFADFV